jgi:hypothetical protein
LSHFSISSFIHITTPFSHFHLAAFFAFFSFNGCRRHFHFADSHFATPDIFFIDIFAA